MAPATPSSRTRAVPAAPAPTVAAVTPRIPEAAIAAAFPGLKLTLVGRERVCPLRSPSERNLLRQSGASADAKTCTVAPVRGDGAYRSPTTQRQNGRELHAARTPPQAPTSVTSSCGRLKSQASGSTPLGLIVSLGGSHTSFSAITRSTGGIKPLRLTLGASQPHSDQGQTRLGSPPLSTDREKATRHSSRQTALGPRG